MNRKMVRECDGCGMAAHGRGCAGGKVGRRGMAARAPALAARGRALRQAACACSHATLSCHGPRLPQIRREPLGVVGLVTPWNYPLLMATVRGAGQGRCAGDPAIAASSCRHTVTEQIRLRCS